MIHKFYFKNFFLTLLITTAAAQAQSSVLDDLEQTPAVRTLRAQTTGVFALLSQEAISLQLTQALNERFLALLAPDQLKFCMSLGKIKMHTQLMLELTRNGERAEANNIALRNLVEQHDIIQSALSELCTSDRKLSDANFRTKSRETVVAIHQKNNAVQSILQEQRRSLESETSQEIAENTSMRDALKSRALAHIESSLNSIILWGSRSNRPSAECAYLGTAQGALEVAYSEARSVREDNAFVIALTDMSAYCGGMENQTARLNGLRITLVSQETRQENSNEVSRYEWIYEGGVSTRQNTSQEQNGNSFSWSNTSWSMPLDFRNADKLENRSFLWYGIHALRQELQLRNPIQ